MESTITRGNGDTLRVHSASVRSLVADLADKLNEPSRALTVSNYGVLMNVDPLVKFRPRVPSHVPVAGGQCRPVAVSLDNTFFLRRYRQYTRWPERPKAVLRTSESLSFVVKQKSKIYKNDHPYNGKGEQRSYSHIAFRSPPSPYIESNSQ